MARPVTIFTGQWADLSFDEVCRMMKSFGYDGLEIACWGDHMEASKAISDPAYVDDRKTILDKHGLGAWALGAHLTGQCVGDEWSTQLDGFAPAAVKGKPQEIREWAIEEMKNTARAAAKMGFGVVTGFMGSPIWRYLYSFPPVSQQTIREGFAMIRSLWDPIFDVFDENGVRFALEVHPTEIAYDYYTWKRLLEVFEYRETLGLNFDPSHLIWQGLDPVVFINDFPQRVYHVHMKDAAVTLDGRSGIIGSHLEFGDLRRGWNFRSLGHGDVRFEEIIRALNNIGYTGPLSVEWEDNGMDREFGAKEACDFVKKINFSPSTVAFDGSMEN